MKTVIHVLGIVLLASSSSRGNICLDMAKNPQAQYTLEEINSCQECGWYLLTDDSRVSLSPSPIPLTGPQLSRLENTESAWCAGEESDYLQIEFSIPIRIGGFKIAGFNTRWVTSLKVYYEDSNGEFLYAKSLADDNEIFHTNESGTSVVKQEFAIPVQAKLVRVIPIGKNNDACLRIDFFSCDATPTVAIARMQSDVGYFGGFYARPRCSLNTREDCGALKCPKYVKDANGCPICKCDNTPGGLFEGDIELTEPTLAIAQVRLGNSNNPEGTYGAGARHEAKFTDYKSNGKYIIYYTMSRDLDSYGSQFQQAFEHISSRTCLQFEQKLNRNVPYYIRFFRGGGCYSAVGKQMNGGGNVISIGHRCEQLGIIVHEIMHALGFWHEQSRPDRDNYVTINWENIQRGTEHNFRKQSSSKINSFGSPYDFKSLMHYGSTAFSVNRIDKTITPKRAGVRLGQRNGLSSEDTKQLNAMYGCHNIGGRTSTTSTAPSTTSTRPTTRPVSRCKDEHRYCSSWARNGYCKRTPAYMMRRCKMSCNFCNCDDAKDINLSCPKWKKYCEREGYIKFMSKYCRKTCLC